ncbi:MAG: hypothetical protein ACTJLM_02390 [Ehrlichia sp.]
MLIESSSRLEKRQLMLRVTTFSLLIFVCLAKMSALACHFLKASKAALYCSMLSYFIILLEGLYLISLKSAAARVCAAVCVVLAGTLLLYNSAILLTQSTDFSFELIISSVLVVITGVMLTIALLCNRYYKRDRELVSKLGGISITSYTSMKDYVKELCKVEYIKLGDYEFQCSDEVRIAVFNSYKAGVFGDLRDVLGDIEGDSALDNVSDTSIVTESGSYDVTRCALPSASMTDLEVAKEETSPEIYDMSKL